MMIRRQKIVIVLTLCGESTLTAVRRGNVCSIHGDDKRIQHGSLTVYSDTVWIHSIIMENRVTAPHGDGIRYGQDTEPQQPLTQIQSNFGDPAA